MKIVFVGPFAMQPKRTMSVRALPLAQALAARGHDVRVLLPPWDHVQDAGKTWVEDGVRVQNVALPPAWPLMRHAFLSVRLVRAALAASPDVIHCFKPKSYAGLSAWVLWQLKRYRLARGQLIVDTDDWEGDGGWNEIDRYSPAQRRFFSWQERWGMTHCDGLTVASRALETIAWSMGIPPQRVHYLPNATWPAKAKATGSAVGLRQRLTLGDAPVALLYTRFFEFSVERVVRIMHGVLEQAPQARWLVIGKGFFGEEERLLQKAREMGIADKIVYAGWVKEEELADYLALAQVAIYPLDDTLINRCKCAVKLIDLLASGVAVVADPVGQNQEYIEQGVSGILAPAGDVDALVTATADLLRDPQRAMALGAAARQSVQRRFAWPDMAETLERFYLREWDPI